MGDGALRRLFAIDLRSLAALRIGLAAILLADLALRARDLRAHYTDAGLLPRALLAEHEVGRGLFWFSLHLAGGSLAFEATLFGVAAAAAMALGLGWRTRLATALSWALLLSLHVRNPLLIYGGDNLLLLALFWSLFLPLGARASLDARAGRGDAGERGGGRPAEAFSVASAGLLLQIALMYLFSAFHKRGSEWWPDGTALDLVLQAGHLARPAAELVRALPLPLWVLTFGTLVLEVVGPLLLFSPVATRPLRGLATAGFAAFHLGILFTLDLMLFNWLGLVTLLIFVPGRAWDALGAGRGPATGATIGLGRLGNGLAAAALAFVVAWNGITLRDDWEAAVETHPVASALVALPLALGLGQTWFMFAPHPVSATKWAAVVGVTAEGRALDLLRGRPPQQRFARPEARADSFPSGRWERVWANAGTSPYIAGWRAVARYFCATAPPGVRRVRVFTVRVPSHADRPPDPPERHRHVDRRCRGAGDGSQEASIGASAWRAAAASS